jgi:hypothetical protein
MIKGIADEVPVKEANGRNEGLMYDSKSWNLLLFAIYFK